jgi:hypothetical protein
VYSDVSPQGPRTRTGLAGILGVALLSLAQLPAASAPTVAVIYRGQPVTEPRPGDLALIHAEGFTSVTWPFTSLAGMATVSRLAHDAGLSVIMRTGSPALTAEVALRGEESVDVNGDATPAAALGPMIWRSIAHGTRTISFDPGISAGGSLVDGQGRRPAWLPTATFIARQLQINGALFAVCKPGPAVSVDPPRPASFDVVLLDAGRSWVIVATNTSPDRLHAVAHFPTDILYGPWLNLLSGSTMAMLSQPDGPKWSLDLEGWGVRVYVIDKTLK